jgi:hypothetical protein
MRTIVLISYYPEGQETRTELLPPCSSRPYLLQFLAGIFL